ncbi:hypothetical protein TUM17383_29120 [Shewanella algae]|nr:hypothetical protein TUM17383_29120 [Shewanella algae]
MTSASELNFYTVLLTFRAKCREFAAKLARYFHNIAGNANKIWTPKYGHPTLMAR